MQILYSCLLVTVFTTDLNASKLLEVKVVDIAVRMNSWNIIADVDGNYGSEGKHPVAVHRKSKTNNTDNKWNSDSLNM